MIPSRRFWPATLVAAWLPLSASAGDTGDAASALLENARHRLGSHLERELVPFWLPSVIDREHGGYRLNHDATGAWRGDADKAIVTQARTVWFFARLAGHGHRRKEALAAARHGYEFLRRSMWDTEHGGFFWSVDSEGRSPRVADKHLYGQAFGLYALSRYALETGDPGARALARRLFLLLEARAHDELHGGYIESFARDWSPPPPGSTNRMGVAPGLKLMNTHLHLMEAITTYVELTRDPLARERLVELILIQSNAVVRKERGACSDRHRRDWTPLSGGENDRVSYGHDIENVWLLIEACRVAGLEDGPLLDLYEVLMRYSLRHGYDHTAGGFWDSGPPGVPADRRAKTWWVQAEGLVATLHMFRRTGRDEYLEAFSGTLRWILERQVDRNVGDWHHIVPEQGPPRGSKAGPWKSPYHNGRAVIRSLELLEPGPRRPPGLPGLPGLPGEAREAREARAR